MCFLANTEVCARPSTARDVTQTPRVTTHPVFKWSQQDKSCRTSQDHMEPGTCVLRAASRWGRRTETGRRRHGDDAAGEGRSHMPPTSAAGGKACLSPGKFYLSLKLHRLSLLLVPLERNTKPAKIPTGPPHSRMSHRAPAGPPWTSIQPPPVTPRSSNPQTH